MREDDQKSQVGSQAHRAAILNPMRRFFLTSAALVWVASGALCLQAQSATTFSVSFPASQSAKPLDGRVLLLLSNDPSDSPEEPRMQINDTLRSQIVFGVTVDGLKPGQPAMGGDKADGNPVR